MDESWRMRMSMGMGIPFATASRRRSTEEYHFSSPPTMGPIRHSTVEALDADDFGDVFGGPPRRLLAKKLSGEFNFYEEIFRLTDNGFPAPAKGGRSLAAFRIPARNGGIYGDVFGTAAAMAAGSEATSMVDGGNYGGGWRSRDRSRPASNAKSNSSSALSSEELSPHRRFSGNDVAFSSFSSKLRPLNVPARWNSNAIMPDKHSSFSSNHTSFMDYYQSVESDYTETFNKSSYYGFAPHVSSPETITPQPDSKISVDDLELNTPSTPASSLCYQDPAETKVDMKTDEDDDDEAMSSYVIEINSGYRECTSEAVSIDEAIAWAKEKYQSTASSDRHPEKETEERPNVYEFFDQRCNEITEEEKEQLEAKIEMEMLDEGIRLWSANKENNIRLLLSTLHHVLWPNSGWYPIPLTSLVESSQVKKAYQKARLCLHPDKLQQRGATVPQKYVSQNAFAILQDAWAQFINQDVF